MPTKIGKWNKLGAYAAQTAIVRQALATDEHSLNDLLRFMRETKQAAIYLSGSRLDNDYCFGSTNVGLLLSVLPEDAPKAAEPGYHPGSTEVYVTFQGSLEMEYLEDCHVRRKILEPQKEVFIIPPAQCHRVRFDSSREAASVIIKTALHAEPSVVRCDNCTIYPSGVAVCPLRQSWKAEKLE